MSLPQVVSRCRSVGIIGGVVAGLSFGLDGTAAAAAPGTSLVEWAGLGQHPGGPGRPRRTAAHGHQGQPLQRLLLRAATWGAHQPGSQRPRRGCWRPFFITQLDEHLVPEWQFQNTNTEACVRQPDGSLSCQDIGDFFEWCVNVPAVDRNAVVYADSEDGNLYAIGQGHRGVFSGPAQRLFLDAAIPGAYTSVSISKDGVIFTQNDGHMIVASRHAV